MARASTHIDDLAAQIRGDMDILRAHMDDSEEADHAFAAMEGFVAIALRIMAKTNPSKVRDAARTEWIKGLMDGKPEVYKPSK
jgi:hypothetical protein